MGWFARALECGDYLPLSLSKNWELLLALAKGQHELKKKTRTSPRTPKSGE
jgi:hypothetical protein